MKCVAVRSGRIRGVVRSFGKGPLVPNMEEYAVSGLYVGEKGALEVEKIDPPLELGNGEKYPYVVPLGELSYERPSPLYITEEAYNDYFRPFVPAKLQAKSFGDINGMNKFLAGLNPADVKEIKDCQTAWVVIYLDKGDER